MSGGIRAVRPRSNVPCRPAAAYVSGSAPVCRYSNVPSCRPAAACVVPAPEQGGAG